MDKNSLYNKSCLRCSLCMPLHNKTGWWCYYEADSGSQWACQRASLSPPLSSAQAGLYVRYEQIAQRKWVVITVWPFVLGESHVLSSVGFGEICLFAFCPWVKWDDRNQSRLCFKAALINFFYILAVNQIILSEMWKGSLVVTNPQSIITWLCSSQRK